MSKNVAIARFLAVATFLTMPILACGAASAVPNLTFGGTLIEPPLCEVNSGELIDVDFGERLGIHKVDGIQYLQKVNYSITCAPGAKDWAMELMLSGEPTPYDVAAIQTNNPDLGIRVLLNGETFILGKPVAVNPADLPVLEVVPVKTPGSTLVEGAFEATATLQAVYQ
ncbi:fimbrial protein [Yersinia enterocolitica]|uniref:Putative fimbrial membrane protein n=1 Tax=Yersinia enterocolitica TaxID=630 RepID=F2Q829_YEREN|nr:putative fimbrial membrane protein [Yersinia enterocolitica]